MILSSWIWQSSLATERAAGSDTLLVEVTPTRKVVFCDNSFSKHVAIGSKGGLVNALSISVRSHVGALVTGGGLRRLTPLRNFLTCGCDARALPLGNPRMEATAETCLKGGRAEALVKACLEEAQEILDPDPLWVKI